HPDRRGHGEHAVRDHIREPDLLGELFVPVDRVEIARGARVLHQRGAGHRDSQRRELGPGLDLVVFQPRCHAHSPSGARATSIVVAVTTCPPYWSYTLPLMLMKSLPAT